MAVDLSVPEFIIRSMLQSREMADRRKAQEIQSEQEAARTDLLRQQHEQQGQQFGELMKHNALQNQLAQQQLKTDQMKNEMNIRGEYLRGNIQRTGSTLTPLADKIAEQLQGGGMQVGPGLATSFRNDPTVSIGGEDVALPGAVSPQEKLAQTLQEQRGLGDVAAETAGKEATAKVPAQISVLGKKQQDAIQLLGMKNDQENFDTQAKIAANKIIQDNHNQTLKDVEAMRARNALNIAGMHYGQDNNEKKTAREKFKLAAANGDLPIDQLSMPEREFVLPDLVSSGGYYTSKQLETAKTAADTMHALQELQGVAKQAASEAPAKNGIEAGIRKGKLWTQKMTQGDDKPSVYNQFNKVAALVTGLGRAIGEKGAFSEKDRQVYQNATVDLGKSDQDNEKAINDLLGVFYRTAVSSLSGAKPEFAAKILKNKFGIDAPTGSGSKVDIEDELSKAPPYDSAGHKLDPVASRKNGVVLYK